MTRNDVKLLVRVFRLMLLVDPQDSLSIENRLLRDVLGAIWAGKSEDPVGCAEEALDWKNAKAIRELTASEETCQ